MPGNGLFTRSLSRCNYSTSLAQALQGRDTIAVSGEIEDRFARFDEPPLGTLQFSFRKTGFEPFNSKVAFDPFHYGTFIRRRKGEVLLVLPRGQGSRGGREAQRSPERAKEARRLLAPEILIDQPLPNRLCGHANVDQLRSI